MRLLIGIFLLSLIASHATAGLYYSGEKMNPLPAKWRGFLSDQRSLRIISAPKTITLVAQTYAESLNKLESEARTRKLTADEFADYGALLIRFGKYERAVEVLRPAARQFPRHFHLAANLGTAWQLAGDLEQAEFSLTDAVELAPANEQAAEAAHLKLVKLRRREGKSPADAPDALFEKEPDVAIVQKLALWLPADGRLLWQLAEIAYRSGDVRTAANILDGCVTEFGMKSETLRKKRTLWRAAVEELDRRQHVSTDRGSLKFRSNRPLARNFDESKLPRIIPDGTTELPWLALAETTVGKSFPPSHLKFVEQLDGKSVSIVGYVRPTSADTDLSTFLFTEFPIGCWFCELPDPNGLVLVELSPGKVTDAVKTPVKIIGTLKLNRDDPESYLFSIINARVGAAD